MTDTDPQSGPPSPAAPEPASPAAPSQVSPAAPGPAEAATPIDIEDFARLDLRVGEVLTAETVPGSDRLLRLTVDLGEPQPRQIVAGLAAFYVPQEFPGRRIVVVANLRPRRLRGFESQGMLLAASADDGGRPVLVTVAEPVANGARLR